jgi:predicted phosphodiesterase
MRALVISDIHANLEALEAVLAAAPPYDVVWNLGDLVGYGANPNEVIDEARRLGDVFVRGNHDRACCGLGGADDFNPIAQAACRWTECVLTDEYIVTVRDAWPSLHETDKRVTFFGHTHMQGGFATNGDEWFRLTPHYRTRDESEEYEIKLRDGARYLLNPGSIGQPRDGDWRAAFALYDDEQMLLTWYRVPYDIREAQERIVDAGLPPRLASRLREGR